MDIQDATDSTTQQRNRPDGRNDSMTQRRFIDAMNSNLVWHPVRITKEDRERLNNHKPVILWFTGLPASGKSTLAHALEEALCKKDIALSFFLFFL